jgi:adenylosuccinate synthase
LSATCVIGLQWGDEAKGKIVDLLTGQYDIVVRYQGGANAGHTVVVGDQVYKLHHVPSGILRPNVINVVGPGVVLNPPVILQEIDGLVSRGVAVGSNLMLSDRAHVVFPWHIAEDRATEAAAAQGTGIGTTLRGIGPCYRDKYGRSYAIRLGDMLRPDFRQRVQQVVDVKRRLLAALAPDLELDAEQIHREFQAYAERLRPHVADTTSYLLDALDGGKRVLLEGAQGTMLDIDHGTFPFVTSSNSSGVGMSAGSGIPARWLAKIVGVAKAYTTRVGGGPFPTELTDATGDRIRELGHEYGTTTGRPRRCGWFDAVAVRYAARLGGIDGIALMMMDVLSHLPEICICTAYELDGRRSQQVPSHAEDLQRVKPIYETLPGWQKDVTGMRRLQDLPAGARRYLDRVSQLVGRPIEMVSVGPDRDQTIRAT